MKEYQYFIRGVTVSGGEPTLQAGFIAELFRRIKGELELSCFVDTNGVFDMGAPEMQELIESADKFMVDIKTVEPTATLCGVEFTGHLKNLEELLKLGKVHEVRTVLIEGFMDMEKTVRTVKHLLKDYPEVEYRLIRVHPAGLDEERKELIRSRVPQVDQMEGIKVT